MMAVGRLPGNVRQMRVREDGNRGEKGWLVCCYQSQVLNYRTNYIMSEPLV